MIFLYTATFTVNCYSRLCSCYLDLLSFLALAPQKRKTKRGERLMVGGEGGGGGGKSFHRNLMIKGFIALLCSSYSWRERGKLLAVAPSTQARFTLVR
jgi:hypothetical protein